MSYTPRLLWGIGSLVLALLAFAAFVQGVLILLPVFALLWFALSLLCGPRTWRR